MLSNLQIDVSLLLKTYELMCTAKSMAELYEAEKDVCSKYVHATSRGHEAIQLATAFQLLPQDFVSPYYRDDSILLGIGITPYELMLQLLAKRDDIFSGGRTYYSHPSLKRKDFPKITHQSSATAMQTIPTTGIAHAIKHKETLNLVDYGDNLPPVVICSLGDGAMTEGEVSEALQMAALKKLPIIYLVQDNDWDISAFAPEFKSSSATYYARGFKGLEAISVDGSDFFESYETMKQVVNIVREQRRPFLVHAKVPLLGHHTSGVRKEWYRSKENLAEHVQRDPIPKFRQALANIGIKDEVLFAIEQDAEERVKEEYQKALMADDPKPEEITNHIFEPTPITEEKGIRKPEGGNEVVMVDAALHAINEIMAESPESLLYGQDVGGDLGGVFREAATLAQKYGHDRVFNTPIQEAYIIGSTVGMSAAGCKPIVEVQFADYIWPGLNQLFTEVSRSNYLSNGKWPVQMVLRVPIGAYGSGGPYHSSSVESVVLNIKGVKVVYPSNAADMKGLMKAAFYDPNPVVIFEHKGLYWSKVPGSKAAMTVEPDSEYVIPIGKANIFQEASAESVKYGESCVVITYGMGVHWALQASKEFKEKVEILDLRSLNPYDWEAIEASVKKHGKVLIVTEESLRNSFAEALSGRIATECFSFLDAPVQIIGAMDVPAIPLNETLEKTMLPSAEKVKAKLEALLNW